MDTMGNESLLDKWTKTTREALRAADRYAASLEIQIYTLAASLMKLEMALREIAVLESVIVETPQGLKAHPAFRLAKDEQDSVTRQMKQLGLTGADLLGQDEANPLFDLTAQVQGPVKNPKIIKPK